MDIHVIDAVIMGEKVNFYHRPSTQKAVNQWLSENEERLTEKGFSSFETYSYSEEN